MDNNKNNNNSNENNNGNSLGTLITKLRKEKGITQKLFAAKLHISDKTVSRWETGGGLPTVDMLIDISKFFNVSFNDLLTLRTAKAKNSEELVKDIVEEFSEANKKNAKKIRYILLFALFVVLILSLIMIFINTYNRFKVYKVNLESSNFVFINGTYVETRIKDVLNLGDIEIKGVEINSTDVVSVDLYIIKNDKEIILYNYSSLDKIYFVGSQSYYKLDDLSKYFDNLYLKVTIINSENEISEYTTKLKFALDFSNNKIFYNDKEPKVTDNITYHKTELSAEEIMEILLNNGFEETSEKMLRKQNKNYTIRYFKDLNKIQYSFEKNNLSYRYTYKLNDHILEVVVFDENNTEISNYKYDVASNERIECLIGNCNDYKEAMKIMHEKILYLFSD